MLPSLIQQMLILIFSFIRIWLVYGWLSFFYLKSIFSQSSVIQFRWTKSKHWNTLLAVVKNKLFRNVTWVFPDWKGVLEQSESMYCLFIKVNLCLSSNPLIQVQCLYRIYELSKWFKTGNRWCDENDGKQQYVFPNNNEWGWVLHYKYVKD